RDAGRSRVLPFRAGCHRGGVELRSGKALRGGAAPRSRRGRRRRFAASRRVVAHTARLRVMPATAGERRAAMRPRVQPRLKRYLRTACIPMSTAFLLLAAQAVATDA